MTGARRTRARSTGLVLALLAALAVGCGESGQEAGSGPRHPEWRWPNADLSNTRHLPTAIDAANVDRLKPAWSIPLSASYAATPVVVDGVAYTADLNSNVYAIDVDSGRLVWRTRWEISDTGPNGVTVADGRVFGVTPTEAIALDAGSGRELWRTSLIQTPSELIVMTPGYKDGIVYVSTTPIAGGDMGTLWALDAESGRRLWGWEQGPRDFWGDPSLNGIGGMWHPPAFDDEGALYVSIADPTPWPGTRELPWARSRPGPNRWSNSLIKLDARSGRFIWGRQVLPHDFYDWDLQCPPILARADGRDVVMTAGKMGFVYAFDADSGKPLWERSVGIHNGHDSDSVRAMHGDYSNLRYERRIYPGDQGGVETQMASDGETLYVPVNNLYAIYHGQELPEMQDYMEGTGEVVALDVATGRVKWVHELPHGAYGGATVTNDLVFTTSYEGTLWALDKRTGAVAWKTRLPAAAIAPVSLAHDTVIAAGSIELGDDQERSIVAFRLPGAGGDDE